MAAQKYASWAAKDTREASSLPSDFDAVIAAAKFTKEAPDGYQAEGNPIFAVIDLLQDGDGAESERTVQQSYSLGGKAGDEFAISDDGYGLIPTGDETAIRKGSKFDMFKCSLENVGVSEAITAAGTLEALIGIKAHWKRIDDAKLLGKEREFVGGKKSTSKFPPQTLVATALVDSKGAGKATAKASTASASSAADSEADIDTLAGQFLIDVLGAAKDNKVQRAQVTLLVSKAAMKDGRRTEIAKRASDEGFLASLAETGLIAYDPAAKPQVVTLVQ